MGESPQSALDRARAAAGPDGRLALPDMAEWDTMPFEGDLRVRPLDDLAEEPARHGEDPATCPGCTRDDSTYVWTDDLWRLGPLVGPSGLPVVVILQPRVHCDLDDQPPEVAASFGPLAARLDRAIRSVGDIARVHIGRWGDGGAHLHWWFFGRPVGQLQLRGSFAAIWDDVLPPLPEHVWRDNLRTVAHALAAEGGTAHV